MKAGSRFFGRQKQSGVVMIICGVCLGVMWISGVLSDEHMGMLPKIMCTVFLLIATGTMIFEGVHVVKMTKENAGYVDDIPDMDKDERGRSIAHSAAYSAMCVTYLLGFAASLILIFCGMAEAGMAVLIVICTLICLFTLFRILEEKIS